MVKSHDNNTDLQLQMGGFSATPSPLQRSKHGSDRIQRKLMPDKSDAKKKRKYPATKKGLPILSSAEEDELLASPVTSNEYISDGMSLPLLSSAEEDALLASPDTSYEYISDGMASREKALSEKSKEECPGCRKQLTRRTIKRHMKAGCPKNRAKKNKCM